MKRKKSKGSKLAIVASLAFILFLFNACSLYFQDTPESRVQSKQKVQDYLQKKYVQKMEIDDNGTFFLGGGRYSFWPRTTDDSNFSFLVCIENGSIVKDTFCEEFIKADISHKLAPFIHSIYSNNDNASIFFEYAGPDLLANQWKILKAPDFNQIKDKISQFRIWVIVNRPFDKTNLDAEFRKMYNLIIMTKTLGYGEATIDFSFEESNKASTNIGFEYTVKDITEIEDIKKHIRLGDLYSDEWNKEICALLNPVILKNYPDAQIEAVSLTYNFDGDSYPDWNKLIIPKYSQGKQLGLVSGLKIFIDIISDFDAADKAMEYQKLFEIIAFIRQKELNPDELYIIFNYSDQRTNTETHLDLKNTELAKIQSAGDLEKQEFKKFKPFG